MVYSSVSVPGMRSTQLFDQMYTQRLLQDPSLEASDSRAKAQDFSKADKIFPFKNNLSFLAFLEVAIKTLLEVWTTYKRQWLVKMVEPVLLANLANEDFDSLGTHLAEPLFFSHLRHGAEVERVLKNLVWLFEFRVGSESTLRSHVGGSSSTYCNTVPFLAVWSVCKLGKFVKFSSWCDGTAI
jgi:hypothetical protein